MDQTFVAGKRRIARARWDILKTALKERDLSKITEHSHDSVRAHNSFDLFNVTSVFLESSSNQKQTQWKAYSMKVDSEETGSILVKEDFSPLSMADLTDSDNTGNVCIWASEEVMAFYAMRNLHKFDQKRVCELGGGSTCLAAMCVAKFGNAFQVLLSDGNMKAVSNLFDIVAQNFQNSDQAPSVRCMRWNNKKSVEELTGQFDVVLCADCLFQDKSRKSLAEAISTILAPGGEAYIFAPRRGNTLDLFVSHCRESFGDTNVKVEQRYDELVWEFHKSKQLCSSYKEDLHYPMIIYLKKKDCWSKRG